MLVVDLGHDTLITETYLYIKMYELKRESWFNVSKRTLTEDIR